MFVVVLTLTQRYNTMQSVVAGQAPTTLEWKNPNLGDQKVAVFISARGPQTYRVVLVLRIRLCTGNPFFTCLRKSKIVEKRKKSENSPECN